VTIYIFHNNIILHTTAKIPRFFFVCFFTWNRHCLIKVNWPNWHHLSSYVFNKLYRCCDHLLNGKDLGFPESLQFMVIFQWNLCYFALFSEISRFAQILIKNQIISMHHFFKIRMTRTKIDSLWPNGNMIIICLWMCIMSRYRRLSKFSNFCAFL